MLRLLVLLSLLLPGSAAWSAPDTLRFAHSGFFADRTGFCAAPNRLAASDCAERQCRANGGTEIECRHVRSCATGGWAFELATTHRSGASWREFHCGFASRPGALSVSEMICALRRETTSCAITRLIDPEGLNVPAD